MPESPSKRPQDRRDPNRLGDALLGSAALAGWVATLSVGVAGFLLAYPDARLAPRPPAATAFPAQELRVELTDDESPPADGPPRPTEVPPTLARASLAPAAPPRMPGPPKAPVSPTAAPPLAEVAVPTTAVAFAVPVAGSAKVVEPAAAAPARAVESSAASAQSGAATAQNGGAQRGSAGGPGQPRQLAFGVGEGRQPPPDYPREAQRTGQQGRVVVQFTVGETGRVVSAEAIEPCDWPLLNQSAVRKIRDTWRFSPGEVRVYQVPIVYRLPR